MSERRDYLKFQLQVITSIFANTFVVHGYD